MRIRVRRVVVVAVAVCVAAAAAWGYLSTRSAGSTPKFRTAKVERGSLTSTVSATGTLNAVVTVQVGSQISGQVKELLADFNSKVTKGQLIARIDPETLESKVNQARADVENARAVVLNQQANVEKAKAEVENARAAVANAKANTAKARVTLVEARRDLDRKNDLLRKELIAKADNDAAETAFQSAAAQVDANQAQERSADSAVRSALASARVAEAQLTAAQAGVKQKQAALVQAQVDLDHTQIRAPVDGVVVSRSVDVGQTVAASLQAPVLFVIAQDLSKMQVDTSIDEAEVGRMQIGQRATFTVDSFPTRTFRAAVREIRKAPVIVQNVVTYNVVMDVENPDSRLLPGMTANVRVVIESKPSVLKVANAALRFRPPGAEPDPASAGRGGGSGGGSSERGGGGAGGGERMSPEAIKERLTKSLSLTDEQQKKLDPILQEARDQRRALADLPEDQRRGRGEKIREAVRVRIREILTPEQQAKYAEFAGGGGSEGRGAGRVWVLGPDGKPKAITLQLGISDGSATEMLSGELTEGQEILTGLVTSASPSSTQPRLRL
jgi:HlyD family secretion protein